MTSQSVDVLIIGAGAAGLSLLLELDNIRDHHSVKVLERNLMPTDDRIWSFWQPKQSGHKDRLAHYLQSIVAKQWDTWCLSTPDKSYAMSDCDYRYCSISAKAFSELALRTTAKNTLREIRYNTEVISIDTCDEQFLVSTAHQTFLAKQVIDTRPPPIMKQHDGLVQCFYGEEISVDIDTFDISSVQLMKHLKASTLGIEFVYILPFSARHALIEFTCFSLHSIDTEVLRQGLHDFIDNFVQQQPRRVLRIEHAILPMYNIKATNVSQPNYTYAGIAGGAMRASTGYSFLNCQRWARVSAIKINAQHALPKVPPINAMYRYMDHIMLTVLNDDISVGIAIFEQIFKKVKPDSFARFMTERANLFDLIAVIWAMPKRTFIRAVFTILLDTISRTNKHLGNGK